MAAPPASPAATTDQSRIALLVARLRQELERAEHSIEYVTAVHSGDREHQAVRTRRAVAAAYRNAVFLAESFANGERDQEV